MNVDNCENVFNFKRKALDKKKLERLHSNKHRTNQQHTKWKTENQSYTRQINVHLFTLWIYEKGNNNHNNNVENVQNE